MTPIRLLAVATAAFGYLLVALSPIVRITGSGMGCGDDWPLCNGRLIPPLENLAVMIEWGHRLAVVGLSVLVLALLALCWVRRHAPGLSGRGGVLGPVLWATGLLVLQSLLGAVTVWFELPAGVVVVHLANAMALLAVLLVAAFRALRAGAAVPRVAPSPRAGRGATVAAGLGAAALLLGALTANLNAGLACTGFPLCSGSLWPEAGAGGLAHIHWTHRLVAYALVLHLVGMIPAAWRRREPGFVRTGLLVATGVLGVHVAVAAWMILALLPMSLRVAHAGLGALVWSALVYLAWISAQRPAAAAQSPQGASGIPPLAAIE